jgi:phosphohistidine swiveling domain-containing protein
LKNNLYRDNSNLYKSIITFIHCIRGRFNLKNSVKFIVKSRDEFDLHFQKLNSIYDYENNNQCIVVKTLNPDFSILLSSVSLIVTLRGHALSHLAIVAKEKGITVIKIDEDFEKIPRKGRIILKNDMIEIF